MHNRKSGERERVTKYIAFPFRLQSSTFSPKNKNAPGKFQGRFKVYSGDDLLSHSVSAAVPSAWRGLTAVFGMGTGVTLSLLSPET